MAPFRGSYHVFLLGALTVGWLSMGYFGALVSRETFTICCCTLALGKTFRFPLLVWGDWCVWLPERSSHDIVAHWLKQNLILPFKTPKLLGLTSILNLNDTHIVLPLDFLIYRNVGEDCLGRLQKNYELLQASTFESLATTQNRCVYCVLGNNAKNMCLLCPWQQRQKYVSTVFAPNTRICTNTIWHLSPTLIMEKRFEQNYHVYLIHGTLELPTSLP